MLEIDIFLDTSYIIANNPLWDNQMKKKSLDLILTDDNLSEYRFFLYTLPERYLDYENDIGLYIFLSENQYEAVPDYYVEVWARVSFNPRLIWQIDSLSVPALDFQEIGFQAILDRINESEDFLPNLRQLIDMVGQAKVEREREQGAAPSDAE